MAADQSVPPAAMAEIDRAIEVLDREIAAEQGSAWCDRDSGVRFARPTCD